MVDAPISAIIATNVTILIKYDSRSFTSFLSRKLVEVHVDSEITFELEWFLVRPWLCIQPGHCKVENDESQDCPLSIKSLKQIYTSIVTLRIAEEIDK